ncbi:MAG: MATE family efflux transporter [Clostridia bacterium]|nr:MATE family efflux transporter [Clostridia bacterium]
MATQRNLTEGSIGGNLLRFSLPYLLSCFLQTFYGMADLFITGQYNGAGVITAVSVGSQLMHMLTVIIVGLAMGGTVTISRSVGAGDDRKAAKAIGNTTVLFLGFSLFLTAVLLACADGILRLLAVPEEAYAQARRYVTICFIGIPFITAYNVLAGIYRGLGDSKRPMYFGAIAGIINVGLDYLFIGPMSLGAAGAALATVLSQALSVILALARLKKTLHIPVKRGDFRPEQGMMKTLLSIGVPVACQDGLIQVAFLVITMIGNRRGVEVAAAIGIVEKVISFLFLVPSAMLSSVSTLCAQNAGAGRHDRSRKTLQYALGISVGFGLIVSILCQFFSEDIVRLFAREEPKVILLGGQYLRTYVFDCMLAGMHFCFSGFFCAYQKSMLSFIHNMLSVVLVRIPGALLATHLYPETLYAMGLAPALGSLLSSIICIIFYVRYRAVWEGGETTAS